MFGFNFAPVGWQLCNGQTLPISQYAALFALLGTTYGGNGTSTFQLPNLQSRVPVHQGQGTGLSTYVMGQQSGNENVSLLTSQIPGHSHMVNAVTGGVGSPNPTGACPATVVVNVATTKVDAYSTGTPNATMNPNMIAPAGGNLPHNNIQPILCVSFCIAMTGIFPSRS